MRRTIFVDGFPSVARGCWSPANRNVIHRGGGRTAPRDVPASATFEKDAHPLVQHRSRVRSVRATGRARPCMPPARPAIRKKQCRRGFTIES